MIDLYCDRLRSTPGASPSTSTTCSTPSTAASNCCCSMRTMKNTASADRRVRRRRPLRHRRSASPDGPALGDPGPCCAAWCAPFAAIGPRPKSCCVATPATPETIDFCRANGFDFIFGVAPTSTLRAHILVLEAKATAMFEAAPKNGKVRRFKVFFDGAQSWSRVGASSPASRPKPTDPIHALSSPI